MTTKTMEGLIGAGTNMELVNTPMRVYKEARLKGDTAVMKRAMGYVNEFEEKAFEYKDVADEGMKEDAKEAREKAELEREKALEKRRKEREEFEGKLEQKREEKLEGAQNTDADTLELSEEGKELLKNNDDLNNSNINISNKPENTDLKTDNFKTPVTYTKTGELSTEKQTVNVSVII